MAAGALKFHYVMWPLQSTSSQSLYPGCRHLFMFGDQKYQISDKHGRIYMCWHILLVVLLSLSRVYSFSTLSITSPQTKQIPVGLLFLADEVIAMVLSQRHTGPAGPPPRPLPEHLCWAGHWIGIWEGQATGGRPCVSADQSSSGAAARAPDRERVSLLQRQNSSCVLFLCLWTHRQELSVQMH